MSIDWFTVIAQILNFLILVWLMKHFLYKPIINAIDTREKQIAADQASAEKTKNEALNERTEFQKKNEAFEKQRTALFSQVKNEVNLERQRLLEEARDSADTLREKKLESLRSETQHLHGAIRLRTQKEVFSIARKTLKDLSTITLEERMSKVFIERLQEMDGEAKRNLGEALATSSYPAILRSAFDLPQEQQTALQNVINDTFSTDIKLRFETSAEQISGIELTTNGYQIAWSIAGYLESLEKGMEDLLGKTDKREEKVEAETGKSEFNQEEQ